MLDKAKQLTGCTSDEQLGQRHLNKSGSTLRNWRSGKTAPDIASLMMLRRLSGISIEEMMYETYEKVA
ncbi:hypothetical protein [Corynebacterium lubricantis]|uniref:hypothetical protein n=1 Tax=Corynebacterium lubricantis TaxID=541095 RepID=UPI0003A3E601|nr:hypothetical protein [Corynebacterium lubricantis]